MHLGSRRESGSCHRAGEREVLLSDLYNNDGIDYIKRRPDEILSEVLLDSLHGWKSTYWNSAARLVRLPRAFRRGDGSTRQRKL